LIDKVEIEKFGKGISGKPAKWTVQILPSAPFAEVAKVVKAPPRTSKLIVIPQKFKLSSSASDLGRNASFEIVVQIHSRPPWAGSLTVKRSA